MVKRRAVAILAVGGILLAGLLAGYWQLASDLPRMAAGFSDEAAPRRAGTVAAVDTAQTPPSPAAELAAEAAGARSAASPGQGDPSAPGTEPRVAGLPPEGAASGGPGTEPAEMPPSFDVVRVEPDGTMVIAGRAPPNADVLLMDGAREIARERASAAGEFAVALDAPLPVGDHEIRIMAARNGRTLPSSQETAIVSIPPKGREGDLLVMVERPNEATRLVTVPKADDPAPETPARELSTAGLPRGGGAGAAGTSPGGTEPGSTDEMAALPDPAPGDRAAATGLPPTGGDGTAGEQSIVAAVTTAASGAAGGSPGGVAAGNAGAALPQGSETRPGSGDEGEARDRIAAVGGEGGEPGTSSIPALSVDAVEIENGTIYVAGTARPGVNVRVYLDDELIADARGSEGDRFLVSAERDVAVGDHRIRADEIRPDGTVVARVEVPFDRPEGETMAAIAAPLDAPAEPDLGPGAAASSPTKREDLAAVAEAGPVLSDDAPSGSDRGASASFAREPSVTSADLAAVGPDGAGRGAAVSGAEPGVEAGRPTVGGADGTGRVVAGTTGTEPAEAGRAPAAGEAGVPTAVAAVRANEAGSGSAAGSEPGITPAAEPEPDNASAAGSEPEIASAAGPEPRGGVGSAGASASTGVTTSVQRPLRPVDARVIIRRGDTLWRISKNAYGLGSRFTVIYLANGDQIRNPNRIYPGQVFRMPGGRHAEGRKTPR